MGFKDIIKRATQKSKDRKELLRRMVEQDKLEELVQERKKSSNLRELERHVKEDQEAQIKEQLDFMRKKREKDIHFGHNPLDVKNITNHVSWEVLKEKNMFAKKGNIFQNQKSILHSNPNLLKSGNILINNSMFEGGGGLI